MAYVPPAAVLDYDGVAWPQPNFQADPSAEDYEDDLAARTDITRLNVYRPPAGSPGSASGSSKQ